MRRHSRLLGGAIAAVMAVTISMAGGPRQEAAAMTAADFAAVLTNQGNAGPSESPEQAAQRLIRLGVPLGDPKAALTEERLSVIMNHYGIQATTTKPDALVGQERGRSAAAILGAALLSQAGTEKRNTSVTTEDLGVCLSERNRGHCVNCCKDLGSPAGACAHFCQSIEPPSPSSPR